MGLNRGMPVAADVVTHLLRRTEFVALPERVAELTAMPSLDAAVDDILNVDPNPPSIDPDPVPPQYVPSEHAERIRKVTNTWIDFMAHRSPRRLQERMALFWHGHFVSDDAKAGYTHTIAEQIDLYRRAGLGNLRELAIDMATTVAMLRYLDNNQNFVDAPNQNFGRELLELFLLGVGNYTEADVEACTAAWTGHGENGHHTNGQYKWNNRHDSTPRAFLGRTTCAHEDPRQHGPDTIRIVLGNPATIGGTVPVGPNQGRPTRDVAAEFISRKLWTYFAGTEIPKDVLAHLRTAAVTNDFALKPWLKALLTHPAFYSTDVRRGLLRAPVDYVVAMLAASGLPAETGNPFWLGDGMGQRLLFPPNVSGWGHNGYYVNASAFSQRAAAAEHVAHYVLAEYWDGPGMHLRRGRLSRAEVWSTGQDPERRRALVRRMLDLMGITVGAQTMAALDEFAVNAKLDPDRNVDELYDLVKLILVSPEMNVA